MTGRTTGVGGIWIPSPVRSDVWTGLPWPGMENVGIREREVDNGRSRTPQSLVSGKVTMSFDGVVVVFWCVCALGFPQTRPSTTEPCTASSFPSYLSWVDVSDGGQSERGNNKRPRDGPIFGAY